jgi:hypothetical protein
VKGGKTGRRGGKGGGDWKLKRGGDERRKGGMQGGREREMRVYNIEGREERGGGMIK